MNIDAFDLGEKLSSHKIEYVLYPKLWEEFSSNELNILGIEWKEIKYLNEEGTDFSPEAKNLPNSGGIYIFIIKCEVLHSAFEFLAYIGRARYTENHNLRVRCKKYLHEYNRDDQRPKVTRMMRYWYKHLYLKYVEICNNDHIDMIEQKLINTLLPPFNDEIPNKTIKQAVAAF